MSAAPAPTLLSRALEPDRGPRCALVLVALGALISLVLGLLSDGMSEADGVTHHMFARFAWSDPRFLLDLWGRPGLTLLHAPLAPLGMLGSRLTSLLLSAATAWLAFCVARRLGVRSAWLVPALLLLQPEFTRLSYDALTETALALYLMLALWLWVTDRPTGSAIVIALGAVTRHEAILLIGLWGLALLGRKQWQLWPWLLWALLAHNILARELLGVWPFAKFFEPKGDVSYGAGSVAHYLMLWPFVVGFGLFPIAAGGLLALDPARRGTRLLQASVALWVLAQSAVYARGSYSSGGYPRFLVPICPLMAIGAAAGLDRLLDRARPLAGLRHATLGLAGLALGATAIDYPLGRIPEPYRTWVAGAQLALGLGLLAVWLRLRSATDGHRVLQRAALVLLALAVVQAGLRCRPHRLTPMQQALKEAAALARETDDRQPISFSSWVVQFHGAHVAWDRLYPGSHDELVRKIEALAPGRVVVWDAQFGPSDYFGIQYDWLRGRPWLTLLRRWPAAGDEAPDVAVFGSTGGPKASDR